VGVGAEGSTEEHEAQGEAMHRRKAWGCGRQTDGAEGWLGGADGNRTERGPRSEQLSVFRAARMGGGDRRGGADQRRREGAAAWAIAGRQARVKMIAHRGRAAGCGDSFSSGTTVIAR